MQDETNYFVLPASGDFVFCYWLIAFCLGFAVVLKVVEMLYNVHDGIQRNAHLRRTIMTFEIHIGELQKATKALKADNDELRNRIARLEKERRG